MSGGICGSLLNGGFGFILCRCFQSILVLTIQKQVNYWNEHGMICLLKLLLSMTLLTWPT